MVFGQILAGGSGTRFGKTKLPKQFLKLGEKPIIVHTIDQFLQNPKIDKILVTVNKKWMNHTEDLIKKFYPKDINKIIVIEGGKTRNETILNGCLYAKENDSEKALVVTHDAVRPFITQRIIDDNIEAGMRANAIDTVIPSADTIVHSIDGKEITEIPVRGEYFLGQTPQTFKAGNFIDLYNSLTEKEKDILTDACKIFVIKGKTVKLVKGEIYNMKITHLEDLEIAKAILKKEEND